MLGYQTGHTIGNLVTGQNAPGLLFEGPVRAVSLVAFSLVPGVLATYFFYSRSRLATIEAQAQQAQRHAAAGAAAGCWNRSSSRTCCSTRWPTCAC